MALENASVPLDEKAKRTRDLLASFYTTNASIDAAFGSSSRSGRSAPADSINSPNFDPDIYMSILVEKLSLDGLLQKHVEMAAEIKNLDTDLQMLVYENYNKFISATDTIKRMKSNIVGMEANMEQLLNKIMSVQARSDAVNTSLFEKREHIEKMHRTRNLLQKVQFIYDLPARLGKCIKTEAYADAVRFFTGAMPIFQAYGDSSFQDCKRASEEAIDIVIQNLQEKLSSEFEPIEARAEAVVLLKQLNFPVDNLKAKLLEKFEECLLKFDNESKKFEFSDSEGFPKASIGEFSKTAHAYLIIFPDSEVRLILLAQDFFTKRYGIVQQHISRRTSAANLQLMLRDIWNDINVMNEVLPEAALPAHCLEAASSLCRQFMATLFSHLLNEISESMMGPPCEPESAVVGIPAGLVNSALVCSIMLIPAVVKSALALPFDDAVNIAVELPFVLPRIFAEILIALPENPALALSEVSVVELPVVENPEIETPVADVVNIIAEVHVTVSENFAEISVVAIKEAANNLTTAQKCGLLNSNELNKANNELVGQTDVVYSKKVRRDLIPKKSIPNTSALAFEPQSAA